LGVGHQRLARLKNRGKKLLTSSFDTTRADKEKFHKPDEGKEKKLNRGDLKKRKNYTPV